MGDPPEDLRAAHGLIARLLARHVRRQIELIEPGMPDARGVAVQAVDWSAKPVS
ncbi:hypothetical protein [Mycobacterium saskatchewanense]|uniref:hypothetical protein n=1 Tax=Mycobacterium saskatchewanense TaxID=220927 RepID=UPI001302E52C|nr:hypothetical protein [Mycobacterium saskatchewanense]